MAKVTGAQLISRSLSEWGVDTAFAIAGDHTLPLMDRMAGDGFRFIDARHEQGAVDMANAWGRIRGIGVSMFTTPGHANAIPGLTFAHQLESPLVNISGSAARPRLGQWAAQELDQIGMAAPVTKSSIMVWDPVRIPELISRAFRTATSGRRGPVHLTIPVDVQTAEVDESTVRAHPPSLHGPPAASMADPGDIEATLDLLGAASRPVIVAGNGAWTIGQGELDRLAEVTRIPVLTEEAARGVIADDHPYCFGISDPRVVEAAKLIGTADAVLLLGKKLDFTLEFGEPPGIAADASIAQVDPEPSVIGRTRGVDIGIAADPRAVVAQLAAAAEGRSWSEGGLVAALRESVARQRRELAALADDGPGIHTMRIHTSVEPLLDDDSAVVLEGADVGFYGAAYLPAVRKDRWFTNGAMGMLGWAIPFGIGAQAALPDSRVVVMAGDGSFGFNGFELDTAVRHRIPVVIVVGNDSVWGIDYHQQVKFFGRAIATELRPGTRYDLVAEALGARGEYVEEAGDVGPALRRALDSDIPSVINVRTSPSPSPLTRWVLDTKQY